MSFNEFIDFIVLAITEERKDKIRGDYHAMLPILLLRGKYIPFEEFYDTFTGADLDLRPADEIMEETDEIEKRLSEK